jgi:hypothetical protein
MTWALLINGTVGSGKTTVAERVGDLLADASVPHAVIDLDHLCRSWPAPPGDRFNLGVRLRNLRSVAGTYVEAGATHLVLAGVVETREQRALHDDAVGTELTVCRLTVEQAELNRRLRARHYDDHQSLLWHLRRAPELASILDDAGVDDFSVDATHAPAQEIAAIVARTAGWR